MGYMRYVLPKRTAIYVKVSIDRKKLDLGSGEYIQECIKHSEQLVLINPFEKNKLNLLRNRYRT